MYEYIMNNFNCRNNFKDFGYDTYEECCADYPTKCDNVDSSAKCNSIREYSHFDIKTCMPTGWLQKNDDCWIDSTLYALFSPKGISNFFSNLLDMIHNSSEPDEKLFALNINNYLHGINDIKWSDVDNLNTENNCKQKIKNDITKYIISWEVRNKKMFNFNNENMFNLQFYKDRNGDVGRGPQTIIIKFLYELTKQYIDLYEIIGTQNTIKHNKRIKEVAENKIKENSNNKKIKIISILANDIRDTKRNDTTQLKEIQHIRNYTLQSIIYGSGAHIKTLSLCNVKYI